MVDLKGRTFKPVTTRDWRMVSEALRGLSILLMIIGDDADGMLVIATATLKICGTIAYALPWPGEEEGGPPKAIWKAEDLRPVALRWSDVRLLCRWAFVRCCSVSLSPADSNPAPFASSLTGVFSCHGCAAAAVLPLVGEPMCFRRGFRDRRVLVSEVTNHLVGISTNHQDSGRTMTPLLTSGPSCSLLLLPA